MIPRARPGRISYGFTDEQFVLAWWMSETVSRAAGELSKLCGVTVPVKIVSDRASYYRKLGVNLKRMKRVFPPSMDVVSLNALVRQQ